MQLLSDYVLILLRVELSLELGDGGVDVARRERTVEEVVPQTEKETARVEDGETKPHASERSAVKL